MAKITLNDVTDITLPSSATTINSNSTEIEEAFENTLSRDGTTPNQMEVDLDMNSNRILNLPTPINNAEAANKKYVDDKVAAGSGTSLINGDTVLVIATGTPTARTLATRERDDQFNPMNYGAVGDGVANDTLAFNAVRDAVFADIDNVPGVDSRRGDINLAGRRYKTTASINMTDMRSSHGNLQFGNGTILSHALGKNAVDFTGSRGFRFHDLYIRGDEVNTPRTGLALQRRQLGSNPGAGNHDVQNVKFDGAFSKAGLYHYASEVNTYRNNQVANNKRDPNAYAAMFMGMDIDPSNAAISDFITPAVGELSNITIKGENNSFIRTNNPSITITGITQANPAVVTYSGTLLEAGFNIVIDGVVGMTQVNEGVFTPAAITSTTFQLQGIDSTGFTAYVSGGNVYYVTGPAVYFNQLRAHKHENIYCVTYGSHHVVVEDSDVGNAVDDIGSLWLEFHGEGAGIQSNVHFKAPNRTLRLNDFRFYEHNCHSFKTLFSQDVGAAGKVVFNGADIKVEGGMPGAFTFSNATIFDTPVKYQFNDKSTISFFDSAKIGIGSFHPGALLRMPDEINCRNERYSRKYNYQISSAHDQIIDLCGNLFNPVTTTNALSYHDGWLDRTGSLGGSIQKTENPITAENYVSFNTGTTLDFSDSGNLRRGPRIFSPVQSDMHLEFVIAPGSGATTSQAWCVGWEAANTTTTLADTDNVASLSAADVLTVNANNACGLIHDATGTVDKVYVFSRNAGGAAVLTDTGIIPVNQVKMYWRLFLTEGAILHVFHSPDGIDWTRTNLISASMSQSEKYAPVISHKLASGVVSRELRLHRINAIVLRS